MNLRLKSYDLILKTLVCFSMTLILSHALAADEDDIWVEDHRPEETELVEYHVPVEVNANYKDRRTTSGALLAINYENVMLDRYVSVIDETTFYQDMFGESEFQVYNFNAGYKYNFSLGSLTASLGYGMGEIGSDGSGVQRTLSLTKMTASATYIMDNIFEEPYAAPYGTFGAMKLSITESDPTLEVTKDIGTVYYYQAGLLFQLNWLDDSVSRRNMMDYGLENTYLDVFMAKYEPSSNTELPDTSTDFTFGAGLRLEF